MNSQQEIPVMTQETANLNRLQAIIQQQATAIETKEAQLSGSKQMVAELSNSNIDLRAGGMLLQKKAMQMELELNGCKNRINQLEGEVKALTNAKIELLEDKARLEALLSPAEPADDQVDEDSDTFPEFLDKEEADAA